MASTGGLQAGSSTVSLGMAVVVGVGSGVCASRMSAGSAENSMAAGALSPGAGSAHSRDGKIFSS